MNLIPLDAAMPVAFDTLAYAKKLQALGVPAPQAEAQAEAFSEVVLTNLASRRDLAEVESSLKHDLAEMETSLKRDLAEVESRLKRDLAEVKSELKLDLAEMKSSLKHDLAEMEFRLTLRLGGVMMAAVAAIAALIKFA